MGRFWASYSPEEVALGTEAGTLQVSLATLRLPSSGVPEGLNRDAPTAALASRSALGTSPEAARRKERPGGLAVRPTPTRPQRGAALAPARALGHGPGLLSRRRLSVCVFARIHPGVFDPGRVHLGLVETMNCIDSVQLTTALSPPHRHPAQP